MIQFYINSRAVPRAIARHHIASANPSSSLSDLSGIISRAVKGELEAVYFLAVYGVSLTVGG